MYLAKFFDWMPEGNYSYFNVWHIMFIVGGILGSILISFCLRNIGDEKVHKTLKVFAIIMPIFDIVYWTWEIIASGTFHFATSLPFYFCSLFYFVLPFAVFPKSEKIRSGALSYLATVNLIAGLMGLIFNTHLNHYPMFSFVGLRTMFYHIMMIFVSCFIWITKYYKPQIEHTWIFFLPVLVLVVPAGITNILAGGDYMFLAGGAGTPFAIVSKAVPLPVYDFILLLVMYLLVNLLFFTPTIVRYAKERRRVNSETINKNDINLQ